MSHVGTSFQYKYCLKQKYDQNVSTQILCKNSLQLVVNLASACRLDKQTEISVSLIGHLARMQTLLFTHWTKIQDWKIFHNKLMMDVIGFFLAFDAKIKGWCVILSHSPFQMVKFISTQKLLKLVLAYLQLNQEKPNPSMS